MGGATQLTLMLVELRLSKLTSWGGADGADGGRGVRVMVKQGGLWRHSNLPSGLLTEKVRDNLILVLEKLIPVQFFLCITN